jgi:hypothetical protein
MKTLKFMHIPKTGGSSIENVGIPYEMHWGHSDLQLKHAQWESIRESEKVYFHYPLYLVKDPQTYKYWRETFDYFCVVRNPYEKCVSEYFCPYFETLSRSYEATVEEFNKTIQEYAQSKFTSSHWAPQSLFVYHHDLTDEGAIQGEQIIKYVLRFENLESEFNQLMEDLNLEPRLTLRMNVGNKRFGVNDLTPETLRIIEEVYRADFENFGYPMLSKE